MGCLSADRTLVPHDALDYCVRGTPRVPSPLPSSRATVLSTPRLGLQEPGPTSALGHVLPKLTNSFRPNPSDGGFAPQTFQQSCQFSQSGPRLRGPRLWAVTGGLLIGAGQTANNPTCNRRAIRGRARELRCLARASSTRLHQLFHLRPAEADDGATDL